jgi:DNA-binding HxlR family transcriptional regulator
LTKEPRFWGSWKGRVLRAIAIEGMMTFDEIRNAAGLSPKVLNRVIAELRSAKVLTGKKVGKYTEYEIEPKLRKAYREHSDIIEAEKTEGAKEKKKAHLSWVLKWIEDNGIDASLENNHFFLESANLREISRKLIKRAVASVFVVKPFVMFPMRESKSL